MASALKGDMDHTMNACKALNKYYNLIVKQPVIEWIFVGSVNLSKDLVLLRVHANLWPALWKVIYSTGEDIVDFGHQFSKYYEESLKYASTLTNGNSTAEEKKQAEASISSCLTNGLLPLLNQKLNSARSTKSSCQKFHDNFTADLQKLKESLIEVDKVIRETNFDIKNLQTKIKESGGPIRFEGVTIPSPELIKWNGELLLKNIELSRLNSIKTIINKFSQDATGVFNSSAAIYNSWISISQSINETIGEAVHASSDTTLAILVTSDLKAMNDDWQDTAAYVKNLLPKDGVLPDVAEDGVVKLLSSILGIPEPEVLKLIEKYIGK